MSIKELKPLLKGRNLMSSGPRDVLVERLQKALDEEAAEEAATKAAEAERRRKRASEAQISQEEAIAEVLKEVGGLRVSWLWF